MTHNNHLPAFSNIRPEVSWQKLTTHQQQQLSSLSSQQGNWLSLKSNYTFPFGYFQLQQNKASYFYKIMPKLKAESVYLGNEVACYVNQIQPSLLIIESRSIKQLLINNKAASVLCYPYKECRLSNFSPEDICEATTKLAKMHSVLQNYPKQEKIETASQIKLNNLKVALDKLDIEPNWHNFVPKQALIILMREGLNAINSLYFEQQVIHGDLNVGNIVFDTDGAAIFIDFENCQSSYFPVSYDLAYIAQRFLTTEPTSKFARELKTLCQNYLTHNSNIEKTVADLAQEVLAMMVTIPVYCMSLLLTRAIEHNNSSMTAEWEKFIAMYKQASELKKNSNINDLFGN